ncbi:MAG TPA: tetratricopeptide repeat protein [Ktedonobacteraceae bacterium]|nr:tetratricopeptide repeat protein [Ktedonobacteraceae bacterium]
MAAATPLEIFCSYAHKDEELQKALRAHLSTLEHQGRAFLWHDRLLVAGMDWASTIDEHLNSAALILLLISADFLASNYCYGVEMKRALQRHDASEALVIPVLLRAVEWQDERIARLQALPANARPVTSWDNQDEAFVNIAAGIRKALNHFSPATAGDQNRVWSVPHQRNPLFIGREEELQAIENALKSGQNAAIVQAINGLGGVGKTQLALEYAYRHRAEYRYVFWVLADTRETLSGAYLTIAEQLNLPGKSQPEQRYIIEAVKSWLEKTPDWLLILDNADDPTVLPDFLPTVAGGRILLTTRAHALRHLAESIEIKKLPDEKAISFVYRVQGKYKEAVKLYRRALKICWKVLGREHPDTAMSLRGLANVYRAQGKYGKAVKLHQRALKIYRKVLGEKHPDTARTLNNFGELYHAQEKYRDAEDFYQQALSIDRKVLGEAHPDVAHILNNLGKLYADQGIYRDALPLFKQALAIRLEKLGAEHPETKKTRANYEETLRKLKEEEKEHE